MAKWWPLKAFNLTISGSNGAFEVTVVLPVAKFWLSVVTPYNNMLLWLTMFLQPITTRIVAPVTSTTTHLFKAGFNFLVELRFREIRIINLFFRNDPPKIFEHFNSEIKPSENVFLGTKLIPKQRLIILAWWVRLVRIVW